MKRILFISMYPLSSPRWGAEQRVLSLIDSLSELGFQTGYLSLNKEVRCIERPSVDRVYQLKKNRLKFLFSEFSRRVKNLFFNSIDTFVWERQFSSAVVAAECDFKPDIVIVEYIWLSKAIKYLKTSPFVLIDTHDVFSKKKLLADKGINPFFYCSEKEERRALLRSDAIIAIQKEEEEWFREHVPERKVITISHVQEVEKSESNQKTILFVGSAWPANIEGLRGFVRNVWSKIWSDYSDWELQIAGEASSYFLGVDGCKCFGYVEDLNKVYNEAAIVINPIQYGTGLKIKTVEALCYAKALVTFEEGIRGIVDASKACNVVRSWDDFLVNLSELMSNSELRKDYQSKAYEYAKANFSKEAVYKEFLELF